MQLGITQLVGSKLKKRRTRKQLRTPELINPKREWLVGLGVTALLFVLAVLYAGYDFYRQYTGIDAEFPTEIHLAPFKSKDIPPLIEMYRAREQAFKQIRSSTPVIPVPSESVTVEDGATDSVPPLADESEEQ